MKKGIFFLLAVLGVVCFQSLVYAGTWSQTTQDEFSSDTLSNIDVSTVLGDVSLSGAYSSDSNTILLLHFNEGSGNPKDSSSYGNDGINNDATWTTAGKFGSALIFNGASDYQAV